MIDGSDFCCEPPEDCNVMQYECRDRGDTWYRVRIAELVGPPSDGLLRAALDAPKTAWSTRPPWL